MEYTHLREMDLLRRCRQEDRAAWRELILRYTPMVWRLARRMLSGSREPEDACQEVFMRAYQSFGSYDPTRPFGPWVARLTYHSCLKRAQKTARAPDQLVATADAVPDPVDPDQASPEHEALEREVNGLLASALAGLPARDRALLQLRYREGLSDSEVSEATGIPVNTVKTRIFRARGILRERLRALDEDG